MCSFIRCIRLYVFMMFTSNNNSIILRVRPGAGCGAAGGARAGGGRGARGPRRARAAAGARPQGPGGPGAGLHCPFWDQPGRARGARAAPPPRAGGRGGAPGPVRGSPVRGGGAAGARPSRGRVAVACVATRGRGTGPCARAPRRPAPAAGSTLALPQQAARLGASRQVRGEAEVLPPRERLRGRLGLQVPRRARPRAARASWAAAACARRAHARAATGVER